MRNFISDLISNLSAYHSTISPPPTTDSFPLESAHPKSIKQENNFDILAATGDVRSMLDSDFTCLVDLSTLHLSWIVETSPAATDSTDRRTISRSKYGWVSHGKQGSSFPSGQDRREQGLPAPGLRIIDYSCSENCRNYSPEAVFSSPGAINALVTFLHAYTDSSNSGFAHSGSDGALQCLLPPDSQSHIAIPLFSDEQPAVLLLVSTNRPFRVYEPADVSFASTFGVLCLGSLVKIKLIKADAAKTAFIATVSHELRTPLHGLLSQLELIREFAPKEFLAETEPFLQTAEVCGFSLRDVLNDVLDFGKQEHPNEEFQAGQCTETDISVVATEVLSVAYGRRRQWQTANVEVGELESSVDVYVSIEDSPSGWLARTDVGGLRRVLLNLASNALKYTPAGSIVLSLRELETPVAPDTQEGRRLIEFSVADTGIGMSNEYKEDIFTPFSQENAFNPGSGLGMSISESILKRMGGEIRVSSEVGKGTTVSFTLLLDFVHPRPARTAADSARTIMKTLISQDENTMLSIPRPRTSESSPPSSHNITLPGPRHDSPRPDSPKSLSTIQGIEGNDHNSEDVRVLVVDDNKIGRKILTTLLARKGVPFREASDGLEALAVYRDFLPHLVWTDVSMPVMDGITSAKYMRAIEKELQLRPARICAITGMSSGDDMKQGLLGEAALDEWLVKGQTNLKTLTLGLEKMQRACRQRPASSTAVL
ncbi:hypothetical protein C8J57DRAFT_5042 [Mycena rebaudengoi]|nr:hypothetical protein C8J57DRAFT_5042 [Mycena rebaudengoi]